METVWWASDVVICVTWAGLYFKEFVDVAPLQGELAATMGFSSGKYLNFLLVAIVFACLDLGGSVNVTLCFFDETWLDAIFEPACDLAVLWWLLVIYPTHCSFLVINLVLVCLFDLKEFVWPHYGWVVFYMNLWADMNNCHHLMTFWLSYCRLYLSIWLTLSVYSICEVNYIVLGVFPEPLMTVY